MATSGILETNYAYGVNDKWYLRCSWNVKEQSISGNYTTVNWTVSLITEGSSSWVMCNDINLSIGGSTYNIIGGRQRVNKGTLKSGTYTVYHNEQGKGSMWMALDGCIYKSSKNASGSKTFYLDDIPRGAYFTSVPKSFTDEQNPTVYYKNPAGGAVRVAMTYWDESNNVVVSYQAVSASSSSYTFDLDALNARGTLRSGCSDANSKSIWFYIETKLSGQRFTSYSVSKVNIVNANPTINSFSAVDTNSKTIALTGNSSVVVKGKSNLDLKMSSQAYKGASIYDNQILYGGNWHSCHAATWNSATSGNISFWTQDTRGNDKYEYKNLTLIEYFNPTCSITLGKPSAQGNIDLNIKGSFWNGNFGKVQNVPDVQYLLKENGSTAADQWRKVSITPSGNNINYTVKLTGLDYRKTYYVRAWIGDKLADSYSSSRTFTTKPLFHWSKERFNFNIPVTFGGKKMLDMVWPVGSIYTTVDKTNPSTTLGGTWERFAQGRTLMGVDESQNGFKLPEHKGGERYHTLTIDEMPKHYHNVLNNDDNNKVALWPTKQNIWGSGTSAMNGAYGATGNGNNYLTTAYEGKGQAYDNLPPYITVYFWKRTA